ncbi:SDR family oxidoreductase [Dyella sp. GSA-30]|uniref:SDR family oxidoreductase n=1 Tax=Dyella sp. GSA-30 TaxID=2994496 RepID=UPI0024901603|nr:SDR family oxidoreductase [Dyella sp. GSA-30]
MPSQQGKLAIVTGATGGLGYETALALAQQGAEVILAARNADKGRDALASIRAAVPNANLHFARVDLASLASVADFSASLLEQGRPIDLLVNNAGVMALPKRQETVDGFEMQLGVNYLSHYALTGRLLPLLRKAPAPRVVNLSSLMHRSGKIYLDDLQLQRGYTPTRAYGQSKLAMLMFALELQRRSDAQGWHLLSNAAHPGYARTELIPNGPGTDSFLSRFSMLLQPFMSQSAADGAWPTLQAATAPDAKPAGYYGPDGWFEMRGTSTEAKVSARAKDATVAKRLWELSAQLTGVSFS